MGIRKFWALKVQRRAIFRWHSLLGMLVYLLGIVNLNVGAFLWYVHMHDGAVLRCCDAATLRCCDAAHWLPVPTMRAMRRWKGATGWFGVVSWVVLLLSLGLLLLSTASAARCVYARTSALLTRDLRSFLPNFLGPYARAPGAAGHLCRLAAAAAECIGALYADIGLIGAGGGAHRCAKMRRQLPI